MGSIRGARSVEGRYVQIANAAVQDKRLSFRARGVLACVLSFPPSHRFTADQLAREHGTEGRDAVRAAFKELEDLGYLKRTRRKTEGGKFVTEMVMSDDPSLINADSPTPGNPSSVPPAQTQETAGHTDDGFPGVGEPGVLSNTGSKTKDVPADAGPAPLHPADELTKAWWEHCKKHGRQITQKYVAVRQIVDGALANGVERDLLAKAMARCTEEGMPISGATLQIAIKKINPTPQQAAQANHHTGWLYS